MRSFAKLSEFMGNSSGNMLQRSSSCSIRRDYNNAQIFPGESSGSKEERSHTDIHGRSTRCGSLTHSNPESREGGFPTSVQSWVLPYVTDNLRYHYKLRKELRRGSSGVIRVCILKGTNERFACKTISKLYLSESGMRDVLREVEAMRKLAYHDNVVKLKEVFEDRRNIHLVMELCKGGDLSDVLLRSKQQGISEFEAASMFQQVVQAVKYCHENEVFHRDLKPENIFLDCSDYPKYKLGDFGVSMQLKKGGLTTGVKGTMYFMAPEMLTGEGTYGLQADIWSLGVLLFVLLMGRLPFKGGTASQTYHLIRHAEADFVHPRTGRQLSLHAENLLRQMLTKDPESRATVEEVLASPWLRNNARHYTNHNTCGNMITSFREER